MSWPLRIAAPGGDIELIDAQLGVVGDIPVAETLAALRVAVRDPAFAERVRRQLAWHASRPIAAGRESEAVWLQLRAGHLVARRRPRPTADVFDAPAPVDLADLVGEPPPPEAQAPPVTDFEVQLVDEIGVGLPGVAMLIVHEGTPHEVITDGGGVARLQTEGVSFATAKVARRDEVIALVQPRWDAIRPGEYVTADPETSVRYPSDVSDAVDLLGGLRHTISVQPDVEIVRLLGMHFDTGASFLLPTALPNVRALVDVYGAKEHEAVLVVGHAAAQTEADVADELALERAASVVAFLRDDVDAWLDRYAPGGTCKRWGGGEDKLMLRSLPDFSTKPPHENAVRWFQRTRGLAVDCIAGPQTRRALIGEYMATDGTSLPAGTDAIAHGVGAAFAADATDESKQSAFDGHTEAEHRRAELLLFGPDTPVSPAPTGPQSTPTAPQYPEWRRRARRRVDLSAEGTSKEVTLLEMADVLFRTNSCVVLPEGEDPNATGAHEALQTVGCLATVLRFNDERPGKKVLVAGHCDTTGTTGFNQPLSEERAEVALALLVGDRDTFGHRCHARHTVADYKQILSWISQALGFDCDPGTIDDVAYTGIKPVRHFQDDYNTRRAELGVTGPPISVDGVMGPQTWGAMFDCYEHLLQVELEVDAAGLSQLRAALQFVDDDRRALGFGEHHPLDELGRDGLRSQANRRVEILLFDEGEQPDLDAGGGAPELSEIYLPGRYERVPLSSRLSARAIQLRLCRPDGTPCAHSDYTLSLGNSVSDGQTDAEGWLVIHLDPGEQRLVVDWTDPEEPDPDLARYGRDVQIDVAAADEPDRDRFRNLNYLEPSLAEQLGAYRAEFDRPASVSNDIVLEEMRGWHDGGPPPKSAPVALSA